MVYPDPVVLQEANQLILKLFSPAASEKFPPEIVINNYFDNWNGLKLKFKKMKYPSPFVFLATVLLVFVCFYVIPPASAILQYIRDSKTAVQDPHDHTNIFLIDLDLFVLLKRGGHRSGYVNQTFHAKEVRK